MFNFWDSCTEPPNNLDLKPRIPETSIFEAKSKIWALKNRGALALFLKKSLGHNLMLVNQFWCYWHDFFFIVNLESALLTIYENKNSRSTLKCWNLVPRLLNKTLEVWESKFQNFRGLRGGSVNFYFHIMLKGQMQDLQWRKIHVNTALTSLHRHHFTKISRFFLILSS